MTRRYLLGTMPLMAWAQVGVSPMAGRRVVEIKGKITAVRIGTQMMPSLTVETEKGEAKVVLGSMRYLIDKDFNPKVGGTAVVKGFEVEGYIYARTVQVVEQKLFLELRDEQGRPVWRGMGKKK